jgi:hypothetical protein
MSTHVPALPMPPKLAHISSTPSTRLSHFATLWCEGRRQAASFVHDGAAVGFDYSL